MNLMYNLCIFISALFLSLSTSHAANTLELDAAIIQKAQEMAIAARQNAAEFGDERFVSTIDKIIERKIPKVKIIWMSNENRTCKGPSDAYAVPFFKPNSIHLCEELRDADINYIAQVAIHEMVHTLGFGKGEKFAHEIEMKLIEYAF